MSSSISPRLSAANPFQPPIARQSSEFRNSRTYDVLCRTAGGAWFLGLAIFMIHNILATHGGGMARSLAQVSLSAFYLSLWLLLVIRPISINRAGGLVPSAVALAGTYMPWLMMVLPRQTLPAGGYQIATAIVLAGNILTLIVVWNLGRSFSLVPQARRLVTSGPYAIVRHPLYLAEELMIPGAGLLYLSPVTAALLVVHALVQVRRMFYEEAVLLRTFPEYAAYMATTRRVIPGIW